MKNIGMVWLAGIIATGFGCGVGYAQDPVVSNVRAEQRPGTKLVDVRYNLSAFATVSLTVIDGGQTVSVSAVTGDIGDDINSGSDLQITWNAGADWNGYISTAMVFAVTAVPSDPLYLVVDLSSGPSATNYPVSYLSAVPPGGWPDEYKTTKLVLRRIPAGTFTMGSPTNELGRLADREAQRQVTLTKDFYIGVFEVTQKQWERVMGNWPSYFTSAAYRDSRPVEQVSWNDIRGGVWPGSPSGSGQASVASFVGRVSARTGLSFDLPTEAQWEYACRAGTVEALNSGQNLTNTSSDVSMNVVGRYYYNHPGGSSGSSSVSTAGGTAKVGSYLSNSWGLYDMHGNVWEWSLDWYTASAPGLVDPVGAASGSYRVLRGGSWSDDAWYCRSADRSSGLDPSTRILILGFRISRTLP